MRVLQLARSVLAPEVVEGHLDYSIVAFIVPGLPGPSLHLPSPSDLELAFSPGTWRRLDEVVGQRTHGPAQGRAATLASSTLEGSRLPQTADFLPLGILRVDKSTLTPTRLRASARGNRTTTASLGASAQSGDVESAPARRRRARTLYISCRQTRNRDVVEGAGGL